MADDYISTGERLFWYVAQMQQKRSADVVPMSVLKKAASATLETAAKTKRQDGGRRYSANDKARLQAAYAKAISDLEAEPKRPGVMFTTKNRAASLLQSHCAEAAAKGGNVRPLKDGALEAVFDDKDPHYKLDTVAAKILYPRKFRWIAPPEKPEAELPKEFRVALFGDWGTGMYGAPLIKQCIEADRGRIDLIIHLGDTYYAGYPQEVEDRLIGIWPHRDGAISRSLNGNHEMYAGGRAYAKAIPKLKQTSSCFWFQNENWTLVGLDTSYNNYILPSQFDLNESQIKWLNKVIIQAGKRILLFSHHYLFSAFEPAKAGALLRRTMQKHVAGKQFYGWYWGHEHRCAFYDWSDEWGLFGRCVGHGGFPYFRDKSIKPPKKPAFVKVGARNGAPACVTLDGANPCVVGYENEYGPHGYVMLEFNGEELTERVHDSYGAAEIWVKGHKPAKP